MRKPFRLFLLYLSLFYFIGKTLKEFFVWFYKFRGLFLILCTQKFWMEAWKESIHHFPQPFLPLNFYIKPPNNSFSILPSKIPSVFFLMKLSRDKYTTNVLNRLSQLFEAVVRKKKAKLQKKWNYFLHFFCKKFRKSI